MSDSNGWVIIWEGTTFNSKGVEPGAYANKQAAIDDCRNLNSDTLSDRRYSVVPADGDEHKAALNHVFSWRK